MNNTVAKKLVAITNFLMWRNIKQSALKKFSNIDYYSFSGSYFRKTFPRNICLF